MTAKFENILATTKKMSSYKKNSIILTHFVLIATCCGGLQISISIIGGGARSFLDPDIWQGYFLPAILSFIGALLLIISKYFISIAIPLQFLAVNILKNEALVSQPADLYYVIYSIWLYLLFILTILHLIYNLVLFMRKKARNRNCDYISEKSNKKQKKYF